MAKWLVKTEPGEFSWQDLEAAGRAVWDGVRNPTALRNLRAMEPGDGVLVYHSGAERAAMGIATVAGEPYPDPKAGDPRLAVVDLAPVGRLGRPVALAELKAEAAFEGSPLLRQGRLSVVPLTEEQWCRVLELGGGAR
jgi:predicted RNA-binding protein with PUA-like domain